MAGLSSGEYPVTLDDKGRVSIPAKFREGIPENVLVLTKGIERCIWAHTPDQWKRVSAKLRRTASMSIKKTDMVHHRFLFSTYEVEIDKAGRVALPQKLRDFAGLSRDLTVASDGNRIEIWDTARYEAYEKLIEERLVEVLEEMGPADLYGEDERGRDE
ncbi:MAG: division/cell wall cluster transcriptional repressor MraZ [Treponema sp.]|jgi:MraZ protein|nr:division/cell wall cluster transcriptional repressor MraZ [Treponema sp.]